MFDAEQRRSDRLAAARRAHPAGGGPGHDRADAPARTALVPGSSCGAAGCWSPPGCSASWRASSTPTTPSRWPPPSARWSAMGAVMLWRRRADVRGFAGRRRGGGGRRRWWSFDLLGRSDDLLPWLRWPVLVAGLLAAAGLLVSVRLLRAGAPERSRRRRSSSSWPGPRRTRSTRRRPRTAAPSRRPGRPWRAASAAAGGPGGPRRRSGAASAAGTDPACWAACRQPAGPAAVPAAARRAGAAAAWAGCSTAPRRAPTWSRCCKRDAAAYTWVAAAIGSKNAPGYQLATGAPVMADRRLQRQRPLARRWPSSSSTCRAEDPLLHRRRRRRRQANGGSHASAADLRLGGGQLHRHHGRRRHRLRPDRRLTRGYDSPLPTRHRVGSTAGA